MGPKKVSKSESDSTAVEASARMAPPPTTAPGPSVACGLTRDELRAMLKHVRAKVPGVLYEDNFYKASDPTLNPDTKVLVKKHNTPDDDIEHRCRSCGCTINEHAKQGGATSNALPDPSTWHAMMTRLTFDDAREEVYNREAALKIADEYFDGVYWKKTGFHEIGRFNMLGTSGMMGIGKTEFLLQVAKRLNATPENFHALYVTFNGGSSSLKVAFNKYTTKYGASDAEAAFAFAFLAQVATGALANSLEDVPRVRFPDVMAAYRDAHNVPDKAALVFLVDEVMHLGQDGCSQLMSQLMGQCDKSMRTPPKTLFAFTHLDPRALVKMQSESGRPIKVVQLAPLSFDHWRQVHPDIVAVADTNPAVLQFMLSLAGHPRAIYDGLFDPAIKRKLIDGECVDARALLVSQLKFTIPPNDTMNDVVTKMLCRTATINDIGEWVRDGLFFTCLGFAVNHSGRQGFLSTLLFACWSDEGDRGTLATNLHQLFVADAGVVDAAEVTCEGVLRYYVALMLIARRGTTFTICEFFNTTFINRDLGEISVSVCAAGPRGILVRDVPSFGAKIDEVVKFLNEGYIVTSTDRSEKGVDFLIPFRVASDKTITLDGETFVLKTDELIVGAAQSKMSVDPDWKEIRKQMSWDKPPEGKLPTVRLLLKEKKIFSFPVVFTAKPGSIADETAEHGVFYNAEYLFQQTCAFGVLRFHMTKLKDALPAEFKKMLLD